MSLCICPFACRASQIFIHQRSMRPTSVLCSAILTTPYCLTGKKCPSVITAVPALSSSVVQRLCDHPVSSNLKPMSDLSSHRVSDLILNLRPRLSWGNPTKSAVLLAWRMLGSISSVWYCSTIGQLVISKNGSTCH